MYCANCGKELFESDQYCKYCGTKNEGYKFSNDDTNEDNQGKLSASNIKIISSLKKLPKKTKGLLAFAIIVLIVLLSVGISEIRISKAVVLYNNNEYYKAARLVRHIPNLGRSDLIRIKTARYAGDFYESYLTTKRIRLANGSTKDKDAYRTCFWDLTFGLYIALRNVKTCDNEIEKDEYQKFIDIYYNELQTEFHMSRNDIDVLMDRFESASSVDVEKDMANRWLDGYFF